MPSTPEQFEKLKKPFLKGVSNWIEMMRLFQGTDSIAFAKDNHVDTEPEWDNAISFTMTIKTLMQKMLQWCSIDYDTMKVPSFFCNWQLFLHTFLDNHNSNCPCAEYKARRKTNSSYY